MSEESTSTEIEYVTPSKEWLLGRLQRMDPSDFERFVGDIWDHLGWKTRVVGHPGDRGIDVIATDGESKQLIQAKRYGPQTTVGSPEVQQYASLRLQEDNVDVVTVVTTGDFSQQAAELAPELEVVLVDGDDLLAILDDLEAYDLFAEHFADIHVEDTVGADTTDETATIFERIRSVFDW